MDTFNRKRWKYAVENFATNRPITAELASRLSSVIAYSHRWLGQACAFNNSITSDRIDCEIVRLDARIQADDAVLDTVLSSTSPSLDSLLIAVAVHADANEARVFAVDRSGAVDIEQLQQIASLVVKTVVCMSEPLASPLNNPRSLDLTSTSSGQLLAAVAESPAVEFPPMVIETSDEYWVNTKAAVTAALPKTIRQQLTDLAHALGYEVDSIAASAWAFVIERYCDQANFELVRSDENVSNDQQVLSVDLGAADTPLSLILQIAVQIQGKTSICANIDTAAQKRHSDSGSTDAIEQQELNQRQFAAIHLTSATEFDESSLEDGSYPATISLMLNPEQSLCGVVFDTAIFDRAMASQWLDHWLHCLGQLLTNPFQPVSRVEILPKSDIGKLLDNAGVSQPVHTLKRAWCYDQHIRCTNADDIAIEGNGIQYSYAECDRHSRAIANYFKSIGVVRGARIVVGLGRQPEQIIIALAVLRLGAVYVPLESADPVPRSLAVIEDCEPQLLVVENTQLIEQSQASVPALELQTLMALPEASWEDEPVDPDDGAYIIYTSGTTGRPKGVLVSRSSLAEHCSLFPTIIGMKPRSRVLQFASFAFDVSIEEVFCSLSVGARVCVRDKSMTASPRRFFEAVQAQAIQVLNLPTLFWTVLVEAVANSEIHWPSNITTLIVGGQEIKADDYRAFRLQNTKNIRFFNGYGPTETTVTSTIAELDGMTLVTNKSAIPLSGSSVPIGSPLPGVYHFIVDSRGRLAPPGVSGELHISGPGLAIGYWRQPELTQRSFTQIEVQGRSVRVYKTGDRVACSSGQWVYLGRIDDQIKLRGFRVELGEISSAIEEYYAVKACHVEYAREEGYVSAYLEDPAGSVEWRHLQEHLRARLPEYMIPAHYFTITRFPLNRSGKVDLMALREAALPLSLEADRATETQTEFSSDRQLTLAGLWSDLLDVKVTSKSDSFVDLGGHSILMVTMFSQVEELFGVSVPLRDFFSEPTIDNLDSIIEAGKANLEDSSQGEDALAWVEKSLFELKKGGSAAPLYCICGVELYQNLADAMPASVPAYGIFLPIEESIVADYSQTGTIGDLPTVEAMAADYVTAMRQHQPFGPYKLTGISFGGILAYEIAHQLVSDGEEVEILMLIDSFLPLPWGQQNLQWLRQIAKRLLQGDAGLVQGLFRKICAWVSGVFGKSSGVKNVEGIVKGQGRQDFTKIRNIAYRAAALKYARTIPTTELDLLVVHALDAQWGDGLRNKDHGWGRVTGGKITVIDAPGDHIGVLQAGNVKKWVTRVSEKLLSKEQRAVDGWG